MRENDVSCYHKALVISLVVQYVSLHQCEYFPFLSFPFMICIINANYINLFFCHTMLINTAHANISTNNAIKVSIKQLLSSHCEELTTFVLKLGKYFRSVTIKVFRLTKVFTC